MQRDLPSGTVTFLFSDIEGSTALLHELGTEAYTDALMGHRSSLRDVFSDHGGVEVGTEGDSFFVAFPDAAEAAGAAYDAQQALAGGPIAVRIGLHTGTPHIAEGDYVGEDVHLAARIAASGHGGQVLLSATTAELVAIPVTDLGEHRLKDFDRPVVILQLGSERFPPLRTIANTNLPHPASSFLGRTAEVADVVAALTNGDRIVTLTGPGGSGKTRLCIEAATEVVPEFSAGVFWVELAPLRDPGLVIESIAQTLGAQGDLADYIGEREMLLVLDNLEQVIEASADLSQLVEACPNLRLLVTSRELMRVRGEAEFPVMPLAQWEAVDLFSARAGAPPDDAIAALCDALDNLPLAVELAAARSRLISPSEILERLTGRLDLLKGGRDADPRQQTLRATIEWSHDLLDEAERELFADLSVFRGGATLDAAGEVVAAELDVIASLVDKSMLRHTDDRFWMLETIRQFATEQLDGTGAGGERRHRHAEYFLALAEAAYPHMDRSPKEWLVRLDAEQDNMRAALDRLAAEGETQLALRLAGALWPFWFQRGQYREGIQRLDSLLAADERPTAARAQALNGAGSMATFAEDLETAQRRQEEALALHVELDDPWGVAYSRFLLGLVANESGDYSRSLPIFEEALEAFRELGDDHHTLLGLQTVSFASNKVGDTERAWELRRQIAPLAREADNRRMLAVGLRFEAMIARDDGRLDDAVGLLAQAYAIHADHADIREISWDLLEGASIAAAADRLADSVTALSQSEALRHDRSIVIAWMDEDTRTLADDVRTRLTDAEFSAAWERGQTMSYDEAFEGSIEGSG